jgi:type I restriction enzyme, R subunit
MMRLNKTRVDYLERFQRMIDDYNEGAANLEEFFERRLKFVKDLQVEKKRGVSEGLSEEELAIFDLIAKHELNSPRRKRIGPECLCCCDVIRRNGQHCSS